MKHARKILFITLILFVMGSLIKIGQTATQVRAQEGPDEPERIITIRVDYTVYKWWLIRWSDNQVACEVLTEKEGLPTGSDIYYHCGTTISREWEKSVSCTYGGEEIQNCAGFYLHPLGSSQEHREVQVELPLPEVTISLEGCTLEPSRNICQSTPYLSFQAEEPLPNEQVIRVQGFIGAQPFSCPGNRCLIPLHRTGEDGVLIEFWADSSYGDSSEHFTGKIRVMPWGDFTAPDEPTYDEPFWYVDVLSSQWSGPKPASCADVWQAFPDRTGPPPWLTTPDDPDELASSLSYYYLAGMLIRQGIVDASACPGHGMQDESIASECGVETAMEEVLAWQNYFDGQILQISSDTGVPAQLLKNVFSRESQFWPGIYETFTEAGLGQMTEKGADSVLLWNPDFYDQFCPLVLSEEFCRLGFGNLEEPYQNMLRGALVSTVNATCLDCPMGIDLRQANFSVNVFAESLLANCVQVEQIIYNTTSRSSGSFSSYEDLWRFTLVNYNAGPGCLSDAVDLTLRYGHELSWANVSRNMPEGCQLAVDYVEAISGAPGPVPIPTPWLESTAVVQPEYDPLPTPTPSPPPKQPPY